MVILATLLLREAIEKIDVFFIKLTIILFRLITPMALKLTEMLLITPLEKIC